MSVSLHNARVALLEARRESELASLVLRHGGNPVCVPALREVQRDCADAASHAADVVARAAHDSRGGAVVVLATGVGLERWLHVATDLGKGEILRAGLAGSTVVCRGPKPVAVLKREGLPAQVRAAPPHTTAELLEALAPIDVDGRDAIYVHDGGGMSTVPEALGQRGARTLEIEPYGWALPEDIEPLRQLVRTVVAGGVEAVAITTQVQIVHLFEVAKGIGAEQALGDALRSRVIVAAVGPTCARALHGLGVPPHVMPQQSKMGPLVLALAERIEKDRAARQSG